MEDIPKKATGLPSPRLERLGGRPLCRPWRLAWRPEHTATALRLRDALATTVPSSLRVG